MVYAQNCGELLNHLAFSALASQIGVAWVIPYSVVALSGCWPIGCQSGHSKRLLETRHPFAYFGRSGHSKRLLGMRHPFAYFGIFGGKGIVGYFGFKCTIPVLKGMVLFSFQ